MKSEPVWRRYLRFWGPSAADDVDDEFAFHIRTTIEELTRQGMSPDQARGEALRRFGPIGSVRKECTMIGQRQIERASRVEYLVGWWRDLVYAARVLRAAKASSATAFLILAVGIGASTAVFTLLDRLLYKPLPVANPSELVRVGASFETVDGARNTTNGSLTYPGYLFLRDNAASFAALVVEADLVAREGEPGASTSGGAEAHPVSGNFFEFLGVSSLLGRTLIPDDDTGASDWRVAMASYAFWTRRFDQSPGVVGETVNLRGVPFTIVGVLPPEFRGTSKGRNPDLYIPVAALAELFGPDTLQSVGFRTFRPMGRLRDGVSLTEARSETDRLWPEFVASAAFASRPDRFRPDPATARIEIENGAAGYATLGEERRTSLLLLAVIVATIALIGCINVACLLLARGTARRNEMAIRVSLGAGVARILRQSLIESCLLTTAGTIAGLVLSPSFQSIILAGLRWGDRPLDLALDGRVLAFTAGVALSTGMVCGLAPAFHLLLLGRTAMNPSPAGNRTLASFTSGKALVATEVALSLVLVAGAAMFLRGFQNIRSIPLGFDAQDVSVVRIGPPGNLDLFADGHRILNTQSVSLAESLASTPGFDGVTVADTIPFNDGAVMYNLWVSEGDAAFGGPPAADAGVIRADHNYLDVMAIGLIAGRWFTPRDDRSAPLVGVIGQTLARQLFGNRNPVGRRIRISADTAIEIVGVTADIKHRNIKQPAPNVLYLPIRQAPPGGALSGDTKLQVRTRMTPEQVATVVENEVGESRLQVTVGTASALEDDVGANYSDDRIRMQATLVFGVLALLLSAAGIYGLMAYAVARRRPELAVRMAIGSTAAGIVRLVLTDSLKTVALGLLIGIPAALVAMRVLARFAYQLTPTDPASLIAATTILILTGLLAAAGPAFRAARANPAETVRAE